MTTSWHQRWDEGRIGFHSPDVHPDLIRHEARFLGDSPRRVLVPLCGKSVDLTWLESRGHEVVGIELVPRAVEEYFEARAARPEVEQQGPVTLYRHGRVALVCGDIFEVTSEPVGAIDRIWDRAALVALEGQIRGRYVQALRALASGGALVLQNSFEYDPAVMEGPPWSVPEAEIRELYSDCHIETLARRDAIDDLVRWRERGHAWWMTTTHLIELP